MTDKLKVFGGYIQDNTGCYRAIVATTSQTKAAKLIDKPLHWFRSIWRETKDELEIEIALSSPEQVFQSSGMWEKDFKPVKK